MTGLPGTPIPRLPVKRPGPKGLAPYRPQPGSKAEQLLTAAAETVDEYRAQGRLPLGSREVGYVVTERGWTHNDVPYVEEIVERARRAGLIAWGAIADGRTSEDGPWQVDGPDDIVDQVVADMGTAQLDRQVGQLYRVEVWAEAAAWLTRLRPQCAERGVRVYSGSGSVPVDAIRRAAIRALRTAGEGRCTVLLWIGDLDVNGLRNIATPFADDVRQTAIDLFAPAVVRSEGGRAAREARQRVVARIVDDLLVVRRLLLTPDQVEAHIGEPARATPTPKDLAAGWPWPYKVQAEALRPEIRDQVVASALDALLDPEVREGVLAAEQELQAEARRRLRDALDDGEGS